MKVVFQAFRAATVIVVEVTTPVGNTVTGGPLCRTPLQAPGTGIFIVALSFRVGMTTIGNLDLVFGVLWINISRVKRFAALSLTLLFLYPPAQAVSAI